VNTESARRKRAGYLLLQSIRRLARNEERQSILRQRVVGIKKLPAIMIEIKEPASIFACIHYNVCVRNEHARKRLKIRHEIEQPVQSGGYFAESSNILDNPRKPVGKNSCETICLTLRLNHRKFLFGLSNIPSRESATIVKGGCSSHCKVTLFMI